MGLFKPKLNPEIRAKAERPGVRVFVSVPSASGLPVPERTLAQVYYFDDHVEIDAGGVEYDLSMDKIQSVSIQTNVDRQTQFVSSAGGALLGAAVAGPIGAVVGGRIKEKQTQQTESYLIIHYIGKDGTPAVLSFSLRTRRSAESWPSSFKSDRTSTLKSSFKQSHSPMAGGWLFLCPNGR